MPGDSRKLQRNLSKLLLSVNRGMNYQEKPLPERWLRESSFNSSGLMRHSGNWNGPPSCLTNSEVIFAGRSTSPGGMGALESDARELQAIALLQLYSVHHEVRYLEDSFLAVDWTKGAYVTAGRASIAELRAYLVASESCLLTFSLGSKLSRGWILCSDFFDSWSLPPANELVPVVARYYSELANHPRRRAASWSPAGPTLSRALLRPMIARIRGRRLVVAPPGELQSIPFAGLPDPDDLSKFLGEESEIVQVPSFSSALRLASDRPKREGPLRNVAVFADATYTPDDPRLVARASIADFRAQEPQLYRAVEAIGMRDGRIPRLLYTTAEAARIGAFAPRSRLWLGTDASRKNVLSLNARPFDVLHFAVHGLLNGTDPSLSGLVLARVDPNGRPVPGFLSFSDVYGMKLDGQLIVLSACQTAIGRTYGQAGMLTLSGAFLHAGARQVVATLWQVDDRATSLLMEAFYEGVFRQRLAPQAALSYAQRRLRLTSRWRSPHHWAAFIIQGI